MKVLLSWLREFTPVEASADEIAERLSVSGLAVEEMHRLGEGIENVVVGRVLEIQEIPGKRVVNVTVDYGEGPVTILCGARNYAPGDLVPVAVVGARLPGGMEIGRKEMFGFTSNGMICSARELGVSDDHEGILVLEGEHKLGQDVREALGLDDVLLDIDVTPNRPDCLSVAGVARETAAIFGTPFDESFALPVADPAVPLDATVTIQDAAGCLRYTATILRGASASAATPWWMRRRLQACGMRPISAMVDVTNYVLLERGHPLHAFDLSKLSGSAIVVRKPSKQEKSFTTLDGVERMLARDDVMICDASRPVAIGGIMGGQDSEVSEATTDVLLESASFAPQRILRTARRLGLRTEASVRFERGADPEAPPRAAARAAALIAELTGARLASGIVDVYSKPWKPRRMSLSLARANALIGITATADEAAGFLRSVGCDVETRSRTALRVSPPSWRGDITIEEDLVEEIARLYGYERVPVTLPSGGRRGGLTREQTLRRVARRALLAAGLSEAQTLSLLPPSVFDRMQLPAEHPARNVLRLSNPLSEEESVLRPSLLPGLLLAAQRNVARRNESVALFEIGVVFAPSGEELPTETMLVSWIMTGPRPAGWHAPAAGYDYFDGKGVFESLAGTLGVRDWALKAGALGTPFHPARSAQIVIAGEVAGVVAELHPRVAEAFDLPGRVAAGVVEVPALLAAAEDARDIPLPRFPAAERDVALVVPSQADAASIEAAIRESAGPLLHEIRVFDVYRGAQAGEGKVSIAWRLWFRAPERTLTDEEVDAAMSRISAAAASSGWTVRA